MAGPSGSTAAPAPQDARALTRRILALAVPAFGALIAEPLFLLADTAIIGHLGTAQLAGVGIGTTILHTLTGLMIFLAYATTPAVARLIGAGNPAAAMDRGRDGIWLGLLLGAVLAMFVFSRRLERSMYDEVGDTPGAAGWTLENMRNTMGIVWLTKTGVQANTHMDTVHRVVGNPGVVLVGEGNPNRLKPLMAKEHKRVERLLAGVPVHEVYAGDGEGQVRTRDLQKHLLKMPKNYQKNEVYNLAAKLDAMDSRGRGPQAAGLPGGPLPKQAQNMAGMNRKMRRMQERKGGK